MSTSSTVELIRSRHRARRFAMKIQQKLDRALESFIRVNATNWSPDASEDEREIVNKQVKALIKRIRAGEISDWTDVVATSDKARAPADEMRDISEKKMEQLAATLAVADWIESIRGAGALGLATIVAEAGDLANYPNPAKLWNRLGFAPFEGCAGSTWKRATWRPRALTAEEWTEHPFSGQRYALMHQVAVWLVNAQWIAAGKTEDGEGKPNGIYGQVYFDRRQHTLETHPDWTKGHRRMDALRVTMKAFLKDLWREWNRAPPPPKFAPRAEVPPPSPKPAKAAKPATKRKRKLEPAE